MDWSALPRGPDGCPRCAALEARVRDLERQLDDALAVIARLEARVAELEDRLAADSSNSSRAPSSDPPWVPRYAPKRPTGRPPGGHKGHPGHHRELLPPDQLDAVVAHRPPRCRRCGRPLPPDAPAELRARHQVAELPPPRAVVVTEHRSYACRCAACGARTTEPIPPGVGEGLLRRPAPGGRALLPHGARPRLAAGRGRGGRGGPRLPAGAGERLQS